jgi:hypothetical protein
LVRLSFSSIQDPIPSVFGLNVANDSELARPDGRGSFIVNSSGTWNESLHSKLNNCTVWGKKELDEKRIEKGKLKLCQTSGETF